MDIIFWTFIKCSFKMYHVILEKLILQNYMRFFLKAFSTSTWTAREKDFSTWTDITGATFPPHQEYKLDFQLN